VHQGAKPASGSGWESNPPGDFSDATLGLKPSRQPPLTSGQATPCEDAPIDGCTDGCRPIPKTPVSEDPDLARVIAAWSVLPPDTRAAVLAIIDAAAND